MSPVIVQLAATDVLHSFSLPNFRIKQDAVPGMINQLWWQAKQTGVFDIACAQHCGTNHYKMRGKLTVLEPDALRRLGRRGLGAVARELRPHDRSAHWGWDWDKASHR